MDCKSKLIWRGILLLLMLPAVLWGYGKSVLQLAQGKSDSAQTDTQNSGSQSSQSQDSENSDSQNHGPESGVPKSQCGEKKSEDPGSSSTGNQADLSVSTSTKPASSSDPDEEQPEMIANPVADGQGNERSPERKIEPQNTGESYNQVRAKRPSIPSRFDDPAFGSRPAASRKADVDFPFWGLLGVPSLLFSVLFFVMWGIISGKIQRIMF